MMQPRTFIAYAPFGAGVLCALFYFVRGNDVYGWWTGARDSERHTAYFGLEAFYSSRPTRFYATEGMDLGGGWRYLYSAPGPALERPVPVDDAAARELDRLQGLFAAEWLVFEGDPHEAAEREAYGRMGLILGQAAIRSRRLGKLDERQPVWLHRSHDCDLNVIEYLQRHWPLDCRESFAERMP